MNLVSSFTHLPSHGLAVPPCLILLYRVLDKYTQLAITSLSAIVCHTTGSSSAVLIRPGFSPPLRLSLLQPADPLPLSSSALFHPRQAGHQGIENQFPLGLQSPIQLSPRRNGPMQPQMAQYRTTSDTSISWLETSHMAWMRCLHVRTVWSTRCQPRSKLCSFPRPRNAFASPIAHRVCHLLTNDSIKRIPSYIYSSNSSQPVT
ncbi:hypothetical protein V8C44DRAFT_329650 [Trichoderma aethiopicum]